MNTSETNFWRAAFQPVASMTLDDNATEVVFSSSRPRSQRRAPHSSAFEGKKEANTKKGAAATASLGAANHPADNSQDLDRTPKFTPQPTQPLETEDQSLSPNETKPKGTKKPKGRKSKRGEAGRKAALEARLWRKAAKELAVKNTNTFKAPEENHRSNQAPPSLSHDQPTQPPETAGPCLTPHEKKPEGATASVATHTAHHTQDLDADDETMISTLKSAPEPTQPLETEGSSQTAPQTESEGAKKPRGKKLKRGEAGRRAALEARLRRIANGELAVKNTNKKQKPKPHRRKPFPPRRAAF